MQRGLVILLVLAAHAAAAPAAQAGPTLILDDKTRRPTPVAAPATLVATAPPVPSAAPVVAAVADPAPGPAADPVPAPAGPEAAPAADPVSAPAPPVADAMAAPQSIAPTATPPAADPRRVPLGVVMRGPFRSSRLFAMPLADVVGAYVLTLSGDASLLQKPGLLTSAGVVAIGFGDIAQLEYRHTEAIGVTGLDAPVPAVGVQLKLPLPERAGLPAFGVAFRLGVPRREQLDGVAIAETVTDLYLVGRLRLPGVPWLTLHGGTRISSAKAAPADGGPSEQRTLWLPTAGYEVAMNPAARIVGEIALAPQFQWAGPGALPVIGHGLLGRLGMRWQIVPAVVLDGSLGYQVDDAAPSAGFDAVVSWDIRLGAEVFVPWGALACRAAGVFCN